MYYVNEDVGKWALINGYTNWYKPLCKKFEKIIKFEILHILLQLSITV